MNGELLDRYAYGMWPVVIFNIILFLFFVVSFLRPKKKFEWRSMGAFVGFLIQWPSLTILVMWPLLTFAYYKLAKREERDLEKQFGAEFGEYRRRVPAFMPLLKV